MMLCDSKIGVEQEEGEIPSLRELAAGSVPEG